MQIAKSVAHVLVTGAGGFVGSAASRAFLDAGLQVTALYRKSVPRRLPAHARLGTVNTDLRECLGLPKAFDYLVHCAADVPATCPNPEELLHSNVEGTRRLLAEAERAGARVVVYMSSMAVYGSIAVPIVNERNATAAADPYGKSKLEGERLLREWVDRSGGAGVAIRLPGVVGAGGRNNFLCDSLQKILRDEAVKARNPDAPFNNVVHVDDLASFLTTAIGQAPQGSTVLTLGAREPLSIRDVLSRMYVRAARKERIDWGPGGGTPFLIVYDRALALGYQPATVADSVDRFVADVIAHGNSPDL